MCYFTSGALDARSAIRRKDGPSWVGRAKATDMLNSGPERTPKDADEKGAQERGPVVSTRPGDDTRVGWWGGWGLARAARDSKEVRGFCPL